MGRLIDADALLEHIKKLECHADNKKYEQGLNDFLNYYLPQIINNQPTAYDREKVVAGLEEESDFFGGEPMGSLQKAYYCKGVDKAIDIVKRGGVE